MWLHVTFIFKIVHRRGADRTRNHLVLIEHRKLNDHPIEVEAPYLASLQRHCKLPTTATPAAPATSGMTRRQARRAGRHERREARRAGRQMRREARRNARQMRREARRGLYMQSNKPPKQQ